MGRTRRKKEERWIQHYSNFQKILLVGEGDFSFSACLATAFGTAVNMVATSLDSKEMLLVKYQWSEAHLEELKRQGCVVLHGVDVNTMNIHPILKNMKFDIIIFNFPHAGHFSWLCERDTELIQLHKELLKGYFTSAGKMVSEEGEIHVTHRDDYPYNTWELEKVAGKAGLQLKEKVEFWKEDYPGYHNKRGCHIDSNNTFPLIDCFTFKFTTTTLQNNHEDNQMASGSVSSNSQIKCDCGDIALILTSWTGKNMGRQFVWCPNYLTNSCEFFDWVDPTKSPREKLYDLYVQILDLEKKYEEEVNKAEEGKKSCEEMEKNYKYIKKKYEENEKTIEEWKKRCQGVEKNYKNMEKKCEEEVNKAEEGKMWCEEMEKNYKYVKKKYEENEKSIEEWKKYCQGVEKNYKNMKKKYEENEKTIEEWRKNLKKKCEEEMKKELRRCCEDISIDMKKKCDEEVKRRCEDMEMNYKDLKKKYEEEVNKAEEGKKSCEEMEKNYTYVKKKHEENQKTIEELKKYCEGVEKNYKNMKNKCEEEVKTSDELKRCCEDMEMTYEDVKAKYEEKVEAIEEWKTYDEMMEKTYKEMQKKCEEKVKTAEELCDEMEKKYEDMKKKRNIIVVMIAVFFFFRF